MSDPIRERLSAQDAIVRYAACIDDEDFDTYRGLFVSDVELHGFGPEVIRGVDAWLEFVHKALEPFRATQHLLGPAQIHVVGDRAELRTDLQAQHFFREPRGRILTLWGTYRSSLVKNDGVWRIRRHELSTRATETRNPD
jgi:3-phenylpropionate/cinnamic acid dioxygenase small subunit